MRHYTTADGLAGEAFIAAFCDREGTLWFGTPKGLSRFVPTPGETSPPPPVLIKELSVAGSRLPISAVGESEIRLPDLSANQSQLQIEFVGLSFAPGEVLRYQYSLEGGNAGWSVPTEQRTVTLANLAPGSYRFLVRAIASDDSVTAAPAVVSFRVLPPFWQRWWFIALVGLTLAFILFTFYRYRIKRLLEVERIRTRIATDLHDDIGANLTKIAILSEVAKRQHGSDDEEEGNPLTSIARISRESVAAMSDIVWAINPQRDHLRDLVRRMRQHAEELFSLREIQLVFHALVAEQNLRLTVDMRRDLFLIFKEAINNAARHSNCSQVTIDLVAQGHELTLRIADNGYGFDASADSEGHGLTSMRQRARNLGGTCTVESVTEAGTTVTVKLPYARHGAAPYLKR